MANPPPKPPVNRWRKWLRRAALAGIALLLLLIVGFFLFPFWISNDQGRAYVLDRINARLHGPRLTVDKWSLGWFSPTDLTNLSIMQPDGTEILSCPHVSSGITLWNFLWHSYDLRNTTADELELRLVKFADGTTSLDSLAQAAGDVLQSARGALQIRDGRLFVVSVKTGETIRYAEFRATITVASPEAPFHAQVSAVEVAPVTPAPAPVTGTISLNGTFPPTATLSTSSLYSPGIWALLTDIEFSAMRIPTALACDYAGLDTAWAESFSNMLDTVQITGHPTAAQDGCRLSLVLNGSGNERPEAEALIFLRPPATTRGTATVPAPPPTGGTLQIPSGKDYHIRAALRWSPPLAAALRRLNPILGEATVVPPPVNLPPAAARLIRANIVTLDIPLDDPDLAEATGRITFPLLQFLPKEGPSIVRQLQVITGALPAPRPGAAVQPVEGTAGVLRVRYADRKISYDNFAVTLGKSRIDFSGDILIDGTLNLTALIPESESGLAAGTTRVTVTGTIDTPIVKRPQ